MTPDDVRSIALPFPVFLQSTFLRVEIIQPNSESKVLPKLKHLSLLVLKFPPNKANEKVTTSMTLSFINSDGIRICDRAIILLAPHVHVF